MPRLCFNDAFRAAQQDNAGLFNDVVRSRRPKTSSTTDEIIKSLKRENAEDDKMLLVYQNRARPAARHIHQHH